MCLCSVEEAIEDFRAGNFVIIVDDEDRENEGDLTIASQFATPAAINFMTQYARGLICVSMDHRMLDRLQIPQMVPPHRNKSGFGTGFTLSVEAREGVTTGISAFDRARTIEVLVSPDSLPEDLVFPGHIFPLRAKAGGVLERRGQTEASVDLARLSGLTPSGVICEIMSDDGHMARLPELSEFGRQHNIKIVSVEALAQYREKNETHMGVPPFLNAGIIRGGEASLPTEHGTFKVVAYRDMHNNEDHLALCMGDITDKPPLVRIHSSCLTGDIIGSCRCDCKDQLYLALERIGEEQCGILIYLNQEGRGIGLTNKIRAYSLQDEGLDTVDANLKLGFPADCRSYIQAVAILKDLGVNRLRLMTNNPEKVEALETAGLRVDEWVPHEAPVKPQNETYLLTKAKRMGHHLSLAG